MSEADRIAVGILGGEGGEPIVSTIESLRRWTVLPHEVIVLADEPDPACRSVLPRLEVTAVVVTERAEGPAAAFNRLMARIDARIAILLEAGARVSPEWLERLLAGLASDPSNGLAGPSTNLAWNEQALPEPLRAGHPGEIELVARRLGGRYAGQVRSLGPLHSLCDFCYVVRRGVFESIGPADEAYGTGPCWEMDYNVRAARAGFRGVWVPGAYVHRLPAGARRVLHEAAGFERNRRRYQDKFCGLRLRGEKLDYEPHCRGDACEHFAPASLVTVAAAAEAPRAATFPDAPIPLVSCLMPTGGRAELALRAIQYFERQDYPHRELVIVDDGDGPLTYRLPSDPRIQYLRVPRGLSIGGKRNRAAAAARGEILAQWDDDDWYGPGRLTAQVAPLLAGTAGISGLQGAVTFDLEAWRFWRCSPELHRRMFVEDVHGGTLVFRREVFDRAGGYPNASLAEDAEFLRRAVARGAGIAKLPADGHFLYLRHGANAWSFASGSHVDPQGWSRVAEPGWIADDVEFYRSLREARGWAAPEVREMAGRESRAARAPIGAGSSAPLVSCLMPTADRRRFVPHAIRRFLLQSWTDAELVIVDDGREPVSDLVPQHPRIRYVRLERRLPLGAKRNRACLEARGEILVHWDDDDWSGADRLARQVDALAAGQADLCGLGRVLFYGPAADRATEYVYPADERPWVCGGTLAYRRSFWERHPFAEINVGEDNQFVWGAPGVRVADIKDPTLYLALVHAGNTSPKDLEGPRWKPAPLARVQCVLGADWSCYAELLSGALRVPAASLSARPAPARSSRPSRPCLPAAPRAR